MLKNFRFLKIDENILLEYFVTMKNFRNEQLEQLRLLRIRVRVYGVNTWQVQCLSASARDTQLLPSELRLIEPSTNYVPSTVLQDSQWTSRSERAAIKQHVFFVA